MVAITTLSGQQVDVADETIALVAGPYPHDVGPHTYVYGPMVGALITGEAPQLFVSRLQNMADFAVVTRPNGSPAWVHAKAVSAVRTPLSTEAPSRERGSSMPCWSSVNCINPFKSKCLPQFKYSMHLVLICSIKGQYRKAGKPRSTAVSAGKSSPGRSYEELFKTTRLRRALSLILRSPPQAGISASS
jgi:hypothetical protein